jgi:parallel beta-helix repeat protein
MSHRHPLVLSLVIIIASVCPIATAKTDCVNCGIDGRELNNILTTVSDSTIMDYYPSSVKGGRVIDFESFADGCNIHGFNIGGVTLTCPASSIVEIFKNRCGGSSHSPTTTIGTNVCSCMNSNVNPLVGVFDYPATYIGLWAGDGGEDTDSWELEAFDAPVGGNSLGIVRSGDWNGYPYRKLEISASNIWRFEARWTGAACGVLYDDLDFLIPLLSLEKAADVNDGDCVLPGREITYTINYNPDVPENNNMRIIDYLPVEVDYNSSSPVGDYNATTRTITWTIGSISFGDRGVITINTKVNNLAEPCGVFINRCELRGYLIYNVSEVNTPVCAWNPEIIYVDCNRINGANTGMSWENAYLDLQKALDRASHGFGSQIWVAKGTYKPSIQDPCGPSGVLTFKLINGIPVYGHFAGYETSLSQRNLKDPSNETILTKESYYAYYVVTASGFSQNNTLDGFTITGGYYSRVLIQNASLVISNCLINGNGSVYGGISTSLAGLKRVKNCVIYNNGYGISLSSSNLTVVTGCKIFANSSMGISIDGSSNADISNNWIYRNGGHGIYFYPTTGSTTIRNNTIINNSYGVVCNSSTKPIIASSIIWGNNDDLISCNATYSCIEDNDAGLGNIHTDPCFVNVDGNDFHLRPASLCIDAGDPCFMDFNDTDIDSECRVMFGKSAIRVDIGADELDWPKADFDRNEIVNFFDYAIWAPAWQTTDPNKSLDLDNDVDIDDLSQFCDDWLWEAPW